MKPKYMHKKIISDRETETSSKKGKMEEESIPNNLWGK